MNVRAPILYLDLDGTLLDTREKYHRLHCRIALDLDHEPLPRGTFWARKRSGVDLVTLLPDWDDAARAEYSRRWLAEIELPLYTRFDRLVPGARESLLRLASRFELVLVTLRRDGQELRRQLRRLGIAPLFSRLIVRGDHGGLELTKAELLRLTVASDDERGSIVVGDSEEDVRAARALGGTFVAVLTGMRDRAFLAALGADLIIESVAQLPAALQSALPSPAAGKRRGLPAESSLECFGVRPTSR
jgi:phosphoglycolate phosphatase-like HAD superfamily hydrolase